VIGDASGKDVLITDDEILTGKSILQAIRILRKIGTGKIYVSCTHGFFSNNALDKFCEYPIEVLVTTDTLPVLRGQKNCRWWFYRSQICLPKRSWQFTKANRLATFFPLM
jgi:phosphoribosylpyrophosphate synthetase